MSDITRRMHKLLIKSGFELVRQNNHRVYRNEQGIQIYTSNSASDYRAYKNMISDLRKLGIKIYV